jgi:hypothetical protein
MKFRRFIVFITLMAMIFSPFFDSMACDDFARNSPSPGSGMTVGCKDFSGGSRSAIETGKGSGDQPFPENDVHVLCPICLAVAERLSSFDHDLFEVVFFKLLPAPEILIQPSIPIYKPPQNQSIGSPAFFV